jgi:serine/threonine-protein kinase HipA
MRDRQAVVWTRAGGQAVKMGTLYVTERNARFQYVRDYADTGLPGLSLVYPPRIFRERPVVFHQPGMLHPRFRALIPPSGANNFQRKMLLGILRSDGIIPEPGFDEDWALLLLAGHGGVGHVDVFSNDAEARSWYADDQRAPLVPVNDKLGGTMRDLMAWLEVDARALLRTLGPTPTVGGAIPKLLLAIPATGWTGEVSAPNKRHDPGRLDVVLKMEPMHAYPGLVELEALALDIHVEAGFDVPRYWRCNLGDLPAIAIERFDRDSNDIAMPLESWFSILAAGARDINTHFDGSFDRIAKAIDTPSLTLVADRRTAKRHLYQRLILALLTGNGDLHLGNLSVLGTDERARFSPVYDPTPMRAYSLHNLLCPIPFGNYGDYGRSSNQLTGLSEALLNFAHQLGIRHTEAGEITGTMLKVTANYPERVQALETLPREHRDRLETVAVKMRKVMQDFAGV